MRVRGRFAMTLWCCTGTNLYSTVSRATHRDTGIFPLWVTGSTRQLWPSYVAGCMVCWGGVEDYVRKMFVVPTVECLQEKGTHCVCIQFRFISWCWRGPDLAQMDVDWTCISALAPLFPSRAYAVDRGVRVWYMQDERGWSMYTTCRQRASTQDLQDLLWV